MSYYDIEALATRFKIPVAEATKKIDAWKTNAINVLKDGYEGADLNDFVDSLVPSRLNDIFPMGGLEYAESQVAAGKGGVSKVNTIILGVSNINDDNDVNRREVEGMWWGRKDKDGVMPSAAALAEIREGLERAKKVEVRVSDKGTKYPVALDTRETFQSGDENPNFGKPFPFKPFRYVPMIMNGELVIGKGDLANRDSPEKCLPKVGYKSIVIGKKATKYFKISKDAYKDEGPLTNAWEHVGSVIKESELFMPIKDVVNKLKPYSQFITIGLVDGIVHTEADKANHKPAKVGILLGGDGLSRSIKVSSKYEPVMQDAEKVYKGTEVVVYGQKLQFKNDEGEQVPYYELWGVIVKPDNNRMAAIKKLQELGL